MRQRVQRRRFELFEDRTLLSAGSLDTTFGIGGKVITDFFGSYDAANTMAVQADGKILAAGSTDVAAVSDFALARYNADGTLDTTFGSGGKVVTDFFGGNDRGNVMAMQSDGKIVVAGNAFIDSANRSDFALVRYNPDGTLDSTFGAGGKVVTDFGATTEEVSAIAIQGDGKIVVAGWSLNNNFAISLARYNANGSLDDTFGTSGKVATGFFGFVGATLIEPDGHIIVGGTQFNNSFPLARYTSSGIQDTTFGPGSGDVSVIIFVDGMVRQSDGKIVVAGGSSTNDFAVARYTDTGALDTTFGTGGQLTTDFFESADTANGLGLQSDGKIVVAGDVSTAIGYDFGLARYTSDGVLDGSFGIDGKVTTDFVGADEDATDLAIQDDGKIVVVGYTLADEGTVMTLC
jgi:uncharacterized delta-60 repeat protein